MNTQDTNRSQDHNPFHDDQVEMSDLPGPESTEEAWHPIQKPEQVSLRPRYTLIQRRKQVAITTSIVIIVLLVVLGSTLPLRNIVANTFGIPDLAEPSPGATPHQTGSFPFYFQMLPSWGKLTIDGRPLSHIPTLSSEPPARLAPGTHQLEWKAEPFEPLRCTITIPPAPAATSEQSCKVRPMGANEYAEDAQVIAFPTALSLLSLPENERSALIMTLQNYLDLLQSNDTVLAGERYAYNGRAAYIATEPLQAQLRFLLDTDITKPAACTGLRFGPGCTAAGNDCRLLCTITWPQSMDPALRDGWDIAAIIRPTWTYTAGQDGKELLQPPKGARQADMSGEQHFVTFHITRKQGQWAASFHAQGESSFDDPNCVATIGQIMANPTFRTLEKTQERVHWLFSSGEKRASGCLASATIQDTEMLGLPSPVAADAYLLYRFGVLLVANDEAHRLWPHLPVASIQTRMIAQTIAKEAVFVS